MTTPALTVLIHDGTLYPSRPAGLPGGAVRYLGPVQPTTMLINDEWINLTPAIPAPTPATGVPLVIFDSDMSSDYDDVGDCAVLEGLALLGECQIVGMANSSSNGATALCMDAINTYYGTPDIPIGVRPDVGGNGAYPAQIASEFPHDLQSSASCPRASDMYRKVLAAAPDKSVIIVTAGYLDNLQALMQSGPDQYSSRTGIDLVRQKVRLLACAGGGYPEGGEFNFTVSPVAAQYVVNNWPSAATFSPDNVGRYYYTGGTLARTPNNPIRRVYVDIEHNPIGYPSWTQVAIYQAIRGNTGLFLTNNTGYNQVAANGSNNWVSGPDPTGATDQAYLVERARIPVTDGLNALMTVLPRSTAAGLNVPGAPSDLKATVVSSSQITLNWVSNSYNETSFVIEKRFSDSIYAPIGNVGPGVTSYPVTGLASTANVGFRVKAVNSAGSSYSYSYVWVYSGWTEYNFSVPGQGSPLYSYYQTCYLRWDKGGDYRPNHVTVNNDSNHGQNLTINVLVSAQGSEGSLYVYFFYRDLNNWYRVNYSSSGCRFEKSVGGTTSQIGAAAAFDYRQNPQPYPDYGISNGSPPASWTISANASGRLNLKVARLGNGPVTFLDVTDSMSFSSGKIGLGGNAMTPVWESINFITD